ncbi:MAG: hypothetical protein RJA98_2580 [Pseudomonadota bacterium]|jgi:predicted transcriptional regulator
MKWPNLIDALLRAGVTQAALSARVGTTQSVISDLRLGNTKDPRYSTGQPLLAIAREKLPAELVEQLTGTEGAPNPNPTEVRDAA